MANQEVDDPYVDVDYNYYLYDDMLSYYGVDQLEDLYGDEDEYPETD